jgi:hypothetical protein
VQQYAAFTYYLIRKHAFRCGWPTHLEKRPNCALCVFVPKRRSTRWFLRGTLVSTGLSPPPRD